jgi:hypothetical protein
MGYIAQAIEKSDLLADKYLNRLNFDTKLNWKSNIGRCCTFLAIIFFLVIAGYKGAALFEYDTVFE